MKFFIFTLIFLAIFSCSESVDTSKCADVDCESWQLCNEETGQCELKNSMCSSSDDCLAGYICSDDNRCIIENECFTNEDCKDDTKPICTDGVCIAKSTNECFTNEDCKDDTKPICTDGVCVAESTNECFTNEDCKDDTKPICTDGVCVAEVINKCADVDCESWQLCNTETGLCELKNNMCNDSDDCLVGYSCNDNRCEIINECRIDNDCEDDHLCSMGVCIEDPDFVSSCTENSDCWVNSIKRSCVDLKCAVDRCTADGYECAYNKNNKVVCNTETNRCMEPETDLKGAVKDMVFNILSRLKWTKYTNRNYVYDINAGTLFVDCSFYVKQVIRKVSRAHYTSLPKSSSSGNTALAQDYFNFFNDLKEGNITSDLWEIVPNISQARAGDIIAYAYPPEHEGPTTGHVMVIMSTPQWSNCADNQQHWVWVSDSGNSGHYDDNRNDLGMYKDIYDYNAIDGSGVGIGKMFFNTGTNPYYRWSSCSGEKNPTPILIGRMVLPE